MEEKFTIGCWLHTHYQTGEYLEFDLHYLKGFIQRDILEILQDETEIKELLSDYNVLQKKYLEEPLIIECVAHIDTYEYDPTETWIEIISVNVEVEVTP